MDLYNFLQFFILFREHLRHIEGCPLHKPYCPAWASLPYTYLIFGKYIYKKQKIKQTNKYTDTLLVSWSIFQVFNSDSQPKIAFLLCKPHAFQWNMCILHYFF